VREAVSRAEPLQASADTTVGEGQLRTLRSHRSKHRGSRILAAKHPRTKRMKWSTSGLAHTCAKRTTAFRFGNESTPHFPIRPSAKNSSAKTAAPQDWDAFALQLSKPPRGFLQPAGGGGAGFPAHPRATAVSDFVSQQSARKYPCAASNLPG